jgi:hydrogenase nickel incorporation protein HypA/HybF
VHELSLCQAVAEMVDRTLAELEGRRLRTVHLQVGALTQVVPTTMTACWELLVEDGPLAGSHVEIEHVPVTLACACGATTTVGRDLLLACGTCEGYDVEVRTGEELLVTALDLEPLSDTGEVA